MRGSECDLEDAEGRVVGVWVWGYVRGGSMRSVVLMLVLVARKAGSRRRRAC